MLPSFTQDCNHLGCNPTHDLPPTALQIAQGGTAEAPATMLDAALEYAELGLAVFPCWDKKPLISKQTCPKCLVQCGNIAADGKKPIWTCPRCQRSGGAGFKDASTDPNLISRWWSKWPNAEIGIATGIKSGIVVLDVDNKNGKNGSAALGELEAKLGKLPKTPMASTPNSGTHYYFAHPADGSEIRNSASDIGEGIDVRGTGGYIIAPPSKLANGGEYRWIQD